MRALRLLLLACGLATGCGGITAGASADAGRTDGPPFDATATAPLDSTAGDAVAKDAAGDVAPASDAARDVAPAGDAAADGCADGSCACPCEPPTTGCDSCSICANLQSDPNNCGACDNACPPGSVCTDGACGCQCPAGDVDCVTDAGSCTCVDLQNNNANCGTCGNACMPGNVCAGGSCDCGCQVGELACEQSAAGCTCVDPLTDPYYCGAILPCGYHDAGTVGTRCELGTTCIGGVCQGPCTSGQVLCGIQCIDPQTNLEYCGASGDCSGTSAGVPCPPGTVCIDGTCETPPDE